jgi:hypothetical protein
MAENQKQWVEFGSHTFPSVQVNGVKFRGQVNPDNVFEEICYGFRQMPHYCRKLLKQEHLLVNETKGITSHELAMVLGIILFINLILFVVYRKYLNEELDQELKMQVSSEVSRYVALSQVPELSQITTDETTTNQSLDEDK